MCSCLARWLRGLSGYCTHLSRWLLWRKWRFNSFRFFFFFCNRVSERAWEDVCAPWPNAGPKWGQASHTLHSHCLAGTVSTNQNQLPISTPPHTHTPFPSFLRNLSSPLYISFLSSIPLFGPMSTFRSQIFIIFLKTQPHDSLYSKVGVVPGRKK